MLQFRSQLLLLRFKFIKSFDSVKDIDLKRSKSMVMKPKLTVDIPRSASLNERPKRTKCRKKKRVLCLDGGGIRGLGKVSNHKIY